MCWNDLLFMWKHYLQSLNLPNIIFHNDLKTILEKKINYDKEKDIFINCQSHFLDLVELFKNFWTETIIINKQNDELEIEEFLFHIWCKKKGKNNSFIKSSNFDVIDTVKHFYKSINISNDKFITGIQSKEWNKINVIRDFLLSFRDKNRNEKCTRPVAFDNLYKEYCKCQKNKLICSKQYFKKKLVTLIDVKHIDENIILTSYWQ